MQCGWCKKSGLKQITISALDENGNPSNTKTKELELHMVPGTVARECKGYATFMSLDNAGRVARVN
jgi:hypothetical protein